MHSLAELAFLKTIELGSIRAASRALGQDPSGISRRITQLEQRLGTKLVDRTGKATTPTAKGQVYFERLSRLVDQLHALEAEVSGDDLEPDGLLRVTAAIDFGQEFLTDWLLEFRTLYPRVEFELTLAGGFIDLVQTGVDVAIRVGHLPDSSLIAKKLAEVPRVLVASNGYLERAGVPETPEDLANHDFVLFSAQNRTQPLVLHDAAGRQYRINRSGGVTVNAVRSAVKAVLADQGIHSGPHWAFAHQIATAEVAVILPDFTQGSFPLYAVRQPSTVVPARISRFIEFIGQKVRTIDGLSF
ncbi:MAG: LysR family transcriptional regulator [Pseudomonadota bacterium]